jgi:hypothetical protein
MFVGFIRVFLLNQDSHHIHLVVSFGITAVVNSGCGVNFDTVQTMTVTKSYFAAT